MTSVTSAASRVGEIVSGRYRIDRLIGEGGMGAVYLAEHMLMRKRVALKLLRPEMVDNQEAVARFEREAVAAAHINHPNVVAATDFGKTDDGVFFLALEYVEGTSLRAVLTAPLPASRVVAISRQIARALDRAHIANIVHRDLKPDNVMLVDREGDADFVKVLDFGIAKVPATALESKSAEVAEGAKPEKILTKMGEVLGTPEYMSPEQSMGDPVGPPSDLYALGIVMYEMLTGVHPFNPPNRMMLLTMHVLEPVPPMKERAPNVDVPEELEAIVRRLLEKQPQDRFAKASDVVRALDELRLAPSSARVVVAASKAEKAEPKAETVMGDSAPVRPAPAVDATPKAPPVTTIITRLERAARARPQVVAIAGGAVLLGFVIAAVALAAGGGDAKVEDADAASSAIPTDVVKPPPPPPRAVRATKEQIESAARNPEALEELARQFPTDGAVIRELALAYNEDGRTRDALRTIKSYCALGDKPPSDKELLAIAVRATNGKGEIVDDAFALLEGSFGSDGVDALIELLRGRSLPLSKRAGQSLDKPEVRSQASPAAAVYLDMRAANSCSEKHDLLERVTQEGDARILQQLRNLKQTSGCGFLDFEDCWPCMRRDRALDEAISAVAKRK